MTTEEEIATDTAAEQAKEAAEHEAMIAEMEKRRAEEAAIAAEQDAALQAVKDQCDAYRAALGKE
jgi:hypothetical protein